VVLPSCTVTCTPGCCLASWVSRLREQPSRRGADDAQPCVAAHLVAAAGHVGRDVVELVEHSACSFDHYQALVGETATLAVDEQHAELALQARDVAADVGLDGVEGPGRGRERAVIGDGDQRVVSWRRSITKNDTEYLRNALERSLVHVHTFTC
jgi:hypothetical protein